MFQIYASVAPIVFGFAIMMMGNALLGITVALKLSDAGASNQVIGWVMSAFFAGFMLGTLNGKRLISRLGHVRTFSILAACCAIVALFYALIFDAWVWGGLRFVYGFCMAGLFTVMESWLNERSDNDNRAQVLTFYMSSYYLALALGQLLINFWSLDGFQPFVVAAMLVTLSLLPMLSTSMPQPEVRNERAMSLLELFGISPLAVIGALIAGVMSSGLNGMSAVFARSIGMSVFEVSLFTAAIVFGPFVLLWPFGRLSDRFGRRAALVVVLMLVVATAASAYGLQHFAQPLFGLLGAALLLGGTLSAVYPNAIAHAFDQLPKGQYVAASGGLLMSYSIGAMVGPLLAALCMEHFGPYGLFAYLATISTGLFVYVFYRRRQRPQRPIADKQVFVDVPPTTAAAAELDPRAGADMQSP